MKSINAGSLFTGVLLTALVLVSVGCNEDAPTTESKPVRYVIGVSPFLDDGVKDEVYRHIVGFLLEDMSLNSSLWVYDAYNIRTITQIDVPNVQAFRSSKTRANQFKDQIQKIRAYLAGPHEQPQQGPIPNFNQAIRFPQFMDFVGENLTSTGTPILVMMLGGPLYLDEKEPGFSMVDGYFPSDGHLLASRDESIYGLQSSTNALQNVIVHFGYFGDPWVSEIQREKISRFWALYLKQQGGRLATFSGDLPTVFAAFRTKINALETRNEPFEIDPKETKVEMLRINRDVEVADWIARNVVGSSEPPTRTVGPMKIGIRWNGSIDLDLYARPAHGKEALFFEHKDSPEGYYFKDHRSSPDREYEFIEFEQPVDIWEIEASINFYEGEAAGGPQGEVRIEFDGRIYTGEFHLEAEHGNQGRSGSTQQDFWISLDIPRILKLRES